MDTLLAELNHHREWIAIESEHATALDIPDLVSRFVPAAQATFKAFIGRFLPEDKAISLNRDQRDFIKIVEAEKYLDLAPLAAYVPEGLKVPYLEYANALTLAVDHSVKVQETLSTYTTYLAMLLTNRDQRFSTKDSAVVYKALEAKRSSLNNDLGACFEPGSYRTDVTYGDVVARNNEWQHVFQAIDGLTASINHVDRRALQTNVKNATELLEKLIEVVRKDEMKDASPNIILELSDGAYAVARELELFAAVYYRVLALTTSVNRTTEGIKKIFKEVVH